MPVQGLSTVALAVLAGGEGTRMGRPKIGLLLNGKPILHALLDCLAWPGPTLLSVAPHHAAAPGAERFTRVVPDAAPGQGPLRGLYEILRASPAPLVVVTAVDMPFVAHDRVAWLAGGLAARPQALGLMLRRQGAGLEPLPSAFRTAFAEALTARLNEPRRALHALADDPSVEVIAPPSDWPADTWTNLNTPLDLAPFDRAAGEAPRR
jgi:molybdopterin-guanine dinucleotide biosynthesis protein A